MSRRRSAVVLSASAAVGLFVVGCGTTVPLQGQRTVRVVGGDGAAAGSDLAPDGSVGSDPAATGPAATDAVVDGGDPAGTGASAAPGGTGGASRPGTKSGTTTTPKGAAALPSNGGAGTVTADGYTLGTGVTATTISIGITYTVNADAGNSSIGASGITSGDEKADNDAVIDQINEAGGINGRKLVPVYAAYSATSTQTGQTQDEAACSTFTQDNKVLAVLGPGLTDDLAACLAKAGVLNLSAGRLINKDDAYLKANRTFFMLDTPSQNRMMHDLVKTFTDGRYFTGWNTLNGTPSTTAAVKVGVLGFSSSAWSGPTASVLLPGLKAAGYPVAAADVQQLAQPQSTSDQATLASAVQGAVLKFQQDGVTHVVMLDASGTMTLLFASSAKNQSYYPRLGINSASGAQALSDSGAVSNQQLNGAVGLGWFPSIDLPAAVGNTYQTDATKKCLENVEARTGQSFTSTNAASLALVACDAINSISQALRSTKQLTLNGATLALEALGGSFNAALVPDSFFSATQHDTLQRGWNLAWDTSCTCAKYSNPHIIS